jgi:hypothetical protein
MIPIAEALQRVRGMFLDVQGTRLSIVDAARLSGIDRQLCGDVLEALANGRFLKRGADGTFTRRQADTVDS